jgi:CBS domain-containing protein
MTTVRDIMNTDVVTIAADTTVRAVARTLHAKEISGAPVVDAAGNVVGLVSVADVTRAAGPAGGTDFDNRTARDIMTPATLSVRPDATVQELARFLVRSRVHRAIVLEGGRLAGIVTSHDVLEHLAGIGDTHPPRWPR